LFPLLREYLDTFSALSLWQNSGEQKNACFKTHTAAGSDPKGVFKSVHNNKNNKAQNIWMFENSKGCVHFGHGKELFVPHYAILQSAAADPICC